MKPLLFAVAATLMLAGAASAAPSLVVVTQGDAAVSIVDPETLKVVGRFEEHQPGKVHVHEVAVSPDGAVAYLPVYGDVGVGKPGVDGRTLLFADLKSRAIIDGLDFDKGVRPHSPVVDPSSGLVYVTTELDESVTVVDPTRRKIVGRIPTGATQSHMLALSHDGHVGYTANVASGSVSVLDLVAGKTAAVIPVAGGVQRIAVSTDDRLVFTSDDQNPRLAVIDTAERKVKQWIDLPGLGYGAAATRDGRWLVIALPMLDQVGVIDLKTMKIARTINVGKAPQAVLIRPDGQVAYVSCAASGTVSVIDLANWTVTANVATGPGSDGMAWAPR